ncbi:MAG: tryptophanase [Polyangiaceae bacterium]|nr:tryptophanase [Polyangiaceae bacterium]
MIDHARELFESLIAEPYRTKVVERLRLPERAERERILREAFYSPAYVDARDVYVDFATDSGTGAMSDDQWSALMKGDEAYVRSRSFAAFEGAVREVFGLQHVIPTHQGRAAENIVMELLVKKGDVVLSNTHFDTTKAHVEHRGGLPIDVIGDTLWDFATPDPFKGNFDIARLELALEKYRGRVALVIVTVLNNLAGSSPVSMANIRDVRRAADRHGVKVMFDAARFAENAYFIKTREEGYGDKPIPEIVREMMSYGHGLWMSAKKDAIVNTGGFIATDDEAFARRCQEKLVLYEGFYTYGGLARRDLEAVAVGLREGLDEEYLRHRVGLVAYLGEAMERAGIVVSKPFGGSGIFVDVAALYPHLKPEQLPNVALFCDLYREGGVRAGAGNFTMHTVGPDGSIVDKVFQVARFAVPRRVYSRAHMEYVGGVMARVREVAAQSRGYRVTYMPDVLGHFFAKFAPLDA